MPMQFGEHLLELAPNSRGVRPAFQGAGDVRLDMTGLMPAGALPLVWSVR